jgi:hypothetical protein
MGTIIESHATTGIAFINVSPFIRGSVQAFYSFSSAGISASLNQYIAGEYDWDTSDANLTQASPTQIHGSTNTATGAHASVVVGGVGSADTGTVLLRVTGDSFTDAGVLTIGDNETLIADITAGSVVTDAYFETVKNWTGIVTFELVGTGNFSLDFNFGFSAYVDGSNKDFSITSFRVEGLCGGTDSGFDVRLLKHDPTVWTYAATGFAPGNGAIASMSTDMAPNDTITSGRQFKYKRTELNQFVDGGGSEGYLVEVDTTNNSAVKFSTISVGGRSEELS